ncbi:hypothetical protein V6959_001104 [Vibrio parahaemolyticus]
MKDNELNYLLTAVASKVSNTFIKPTSPIRGDLQASNGILRPRKNDNKILLEDGLIIAHGTYWLSKIVIKADMPHDALSLELETIKGIPYCIGPTRKYSLSDTIGITFEFDVNAFVNKVSISTDAEGKSDLYEMSFEGSSCRDIVATIEYDAKASKRLEKENILLRKELYGVTDKLELVQLQNKLESIEFDNISFDKVFEAKENLASLMLEEREAKIRLKSLEEQEKSRQEFLDTLERREEKAKREVTETEKRHFVLLEQNEDLELLKKSNETVISDKKRQLAQVTESLKVYEKKSELYSEDFSTLKGTVIWQNLIYLGLILALGVFGWQLVKDIYQGALILGLEVDKEMLTMKEIWPLIVSRLPLLTINLFLLGVLSALTNLLVRNIIINNEEIKTVRKVSYLVKETVEKQRVGLDLTDKEVFEQRVNSKMRIIQNQALNSVNIEGEKVVSEEKSIHMHDMLAKFTELLSSKEDSKK